MYLLSYLLASLALISLFAVFLSPSLSPSPSFSVSPSRVFRWILALFPSHAHFLRVQSPGSRDKAAANKSDLKPLDVVHVRTRFALVHSRPPFSTRDDARPPARALDAVKSCFRSRCVAVSQGYKVQACIIACTRVSVLLPADVEIAP